ncbi:MAG: Maf-like protein [Lysobacteraceae bacterium]|nr:MAG: Maf-like protein [Xanthomonadaceae bacterium]
MLLASASPRRAELLTQLGVPFSVSPSDVDESRRSDESARDYVLRVAIDKARVAIDMHAGRLVLAADTSVVIGGQVLGKPGTLAEAHAMLELLSGQDHEVITAVAVGIDGVLKHRVNTTVVRFAELSQVEIAAYVATGEPFDKAGGYGIQGRAGAFVENINGSYSAVMGLPLSDTAQLLRGFGVAMETFW